MMTTKNSTLVTNFEATPQVQNEAHELHGVVRVASGTVALVAGDSTDDDIVMLAPVPANASITQLFVGSDALGGSCTFNVGLYTTAGVVKDEDVFATTVADGAAMADVRFEAADINTAGQQVYELAGDSNADEGYYYVAITFNATGGTAGDVSFLIHYVVN
tara:strand:- start:4899 stop:5381 length:483 start_codon:yes stop_codon:yes gene_type:complete